MRRTLPAPAPLLASVLALAALAGAAAARRAEPPPDLGTLTLDRADPAIDATVAGVPARLAVALDTRDTVELAPAFAGRPADLVWQEDSSEEVGRVRVNTRMAGGEVSVGGLVAPMKLTTHDRPCCGGHDGEVSPLRLPWSTVRIGTSALPERRWPAAFDDVSGLTIPWKTPAGTIRLILSPTSPQTIATASAGAILAKLQGGHFEGEGRRAVVAFAIERQVRDLLFDRPATLLGFTLSRVAVRYADFAGGRALPEDAPDGGIQVKRRGPSPQHEWAAITIGRDLLDACPAISVYRAGPTVGLSCGGGA
jgi:hypothetical protein